MGEPLGPGDLAATFCLTPRPVVVVLLGPGSFEPLAEVVVVVVVDLIGLLLAVLGLEMEVVFREDLGLGLGRPEGDDFFVSDTLAAPTVGGEAF